MTGTNERIGAGTKEAVDEGQEDGRAKSSRGLWSASTMVSCVGRGTWVDHRVGLSFIICLRSISFSSLNSTVIGLISELRAKLCAMWFGNIEDDEAISGR